LNDALAATHRTRLLPLFVGVLNVTLRLTLQTALTDVKEASVMWLHKLGRCGQRPLLAGLRPSSLNAIGLPADGRSTTRCSPSILRKAAIRRRGCGLSTR
jgi:hypothetical protein